MRSKISFLIFFIFLTYMFFCQRSEKKVKLAQQIEITPQQEFKNQLLRSLEVSDSAKVAELVKNNRYQVEAVLESFFNDFLKGKIKGEETEANNQLSYSRWLTNLYQQFFEDDYFQRRLQLLMSWNHTQMLKKLRADSLREEAGQLVKEQDFESSIMLLQKALTMYQDLGDRENNGHVLNIIGDIYHKQRKFSEAIGYFQQALDIAEEIGDYGSAGRCLSNLGSSYHMMEDQKNAIEFLSKALEIAVRIDDLPLQTLILRNMSAVYIDLAQFDKAIEVNQKGLELAKKINDRKMEVYFLNSIGNVYRNIGEYNNALKYLRLALELNQETEDRQSEGSTLREIGVVLYRKGKPDSAFIFWNRSQKIFKEAADTAAMAMVLGYIGIYYKNTGRPHEALNYYEQALELEKKIGYEREASNVMNNMANVYLDILADYDKAEKLYKEALEIKKKVGDEYFAAVLLLNIGSCYKNRGNYQKALENYFEALTISKKIKDKSGEAKYLLEIANIYLDIGDYYRASSYYENALKISTGIGEKKLVMEILVNMGTNYLASGASDSAFMNYENALEIAKELRHKEFEESSYFYLGEAHKRLDNNKKAFQYYSNSLTISQEINNIRAHGEIHTGMGDVYYKLQDYPNAKINYEKGLQIAQKIGSPEGIWRAYYGIGRVLEQMDKNEEEEENYKLAIEVIEAMRAKLIATTLNQSFLEDKIEVYHSIINLLLKMGKDEDAHQYLERSKARSFLDILSTGRINITEGISPERLNRKNELERELNTVQEELLTEYSKNESRQNKEQFTSLELRLKKARQQYNELLQQIELNHPRYATLTGVTEPLTLKQIQQKVIQPGTFLIEYLVGENHTIVWVIGKNLFIYEQVDLKREDLEKMITDLLQPFRDVKEGKIKNLANVGFDLKLSQKLYEQIFLPIEKYVQRDNHLIIVPDGILHYLPFEALVTEVEKKEFDRNIIFSRYENAHYLVKRYAISYSPSASVLDPELFVSDKKNKQEGKLLAFGNPDFGKAREAIKLAKDMKRRLITLYCYLNPVVEVCLINYSKQNKKSGRLLKFSNHPCFISAKKQKKNLSKKKLATSVMSI